MEETLRTNIQNLLESNRVVLFMKGNRSFPQCGFSARVVQILEDQGVDFKDINVLTDADLREGIKEYSSWPTLPQLFVNGQLVGGCDIVSDLASTGELATLLNGT